MNPFSFRAVLRCCGALGLFLLPLAAQASFMHGETLDKFADIMAIVVMIVVPPIAIAVFWVLHVMPEKIAHKKHHPQTPAITTLCLLSLVFGGLLWPLAWLWAFTKPTMYKLAYGTDKSEEFHAKEAEALKLQALQGEVSTLQKTEGLDQASLAALMSRLSAIEAQLKQTRS